MSEDEVMSCDMNIIRLGYKGKVKMLQACFGSSDKSKTHPKPTPNEYRSFVQTHNAVINGARK